MHFAKRFEKIPSYLFAEINRKREDLVAPGVDIINIGVGDTDRSTPTHIVQAMQEAIDDPSNHNYCWTKAASSFLPVTAMGRVAKGFSGLL